MVTNPFQQKTKVEVKLKHEDDQSCVLCTSTGSPIAPVAVLTRNYRPDLPLSISCQRETRGRHMFGYVAGLFRQAYPQKTYGIFPDPAHLLPWCDFMAPMRDDAPSS